MILHKIVSGGQTGGDRAALDVALELRIPIVLVKAWLADTRLVSAAIQWSIPRSSAFSPASCPTDTENRNQRETTHGSVTQWPIPCRAACFAAACSSPARSVDKPCLPNHPVPFRTSRSSSPRKAVARTPFSANSKPPRPQCSSRLTGSLRRPSPKLWWGLTSEA